MSENLLPLGWVLCLILMTVMISGKARGFTGYNAEIPFDFSVGPEIYKAGNYIIKIRKASTVTEWMLADSKGCDLKVFSTVRYGKNSCSEPPCLLFYYYGKQYFLADLATPDDNLIISKPKIEERWSKNQGWVLQKQPLL